MGARQKKNNNSFLIQGAILATASIVVRLIGLVYRIPLTNIIGDEGIGFYSCAFEVYGTALLLSSFSLPLAVSKLVSARVIKGEFKNAFRVFKGALYFALVVGAIISVIIFFGAGFIAKHIMTLELSSYALRVLAPGLLIVAIMGVIRGYFQGLGTMIPTAASQIIEQIINAIVSIIGASYLFHVGKKIGEAKGNELMGPAMGAAGGTLGTVMGALAACIFLAFIVYAYSGIIKRKLKSDQGKDMESYHQIVVILFMTIAPVILSSAVYNIAQVLDQGVFNKVMFAQGYAVKEYVAIWGVYSGKSSLLINVPMSIANAIGTSVIPSLVAVMAMKNKKHIHQKIHLAIRFTMVIAIPSFVGYVVLASPLMQLLFGDARKQPAYMLMLGAITVVFYCLATVMNAILQGLNKLAVPVINAAISLVIHLIALFIMLVMFKWGIYAVIVSNIIFALIMWTLNSRAITKTIGYHQEKAKTFIIPGIASIIMGVITWMVHRILDAWIGGRIATIIALIIAVITYGVSLLMLGGLTESEIISLPGGSALTTVLKKVHLLK
ncbi:MAG: polysaccharide biosynthesis protein [Lachnospiraceae bacterium]